MSVLGIIARGAEGAMSGGDVLAKGEGKKQETILWDAKTEVTRKNNMDRLRATQDFSKSEREAGQAFKAGQVSTGWVTKEGTPVNKTELRGYESQARKAGKTTEEYMRGIGLSSSAEYAETSKRDAQKGAAKKDFDIQNETGAFGDLSKSQEKSLKNDWISSYNSAIRAGKSFPADQFTKVYSDTLTSLNEQGEDQLKADMKGDTGFRGSNIDAYKHYRARKAATDMARSFSGMGGPGAKGGTIQKVQSDKITSLASDTLARMTDRGDIIRWGQEQMSGAKSDTARKAIERAVQGRLANVPESAAPTTTPTTPERVQGETSIQRSIRLRKERKQARPTSILDDDIGGA